MKTLRLRTTYVATDGSAAQLAPVRAKHKGSAHDAPIMHDGKGVLSADDRLNLSMGVDKLRELVDKRIAAGFEGPIAEALLQLAGNDNEKAHVLAGLLAVISRQALEGALRDLADDVASGALASQVRVAMDAADARSHGLLKLGVEYDVEFTEVVHP